MSVGQEFLIVAAGCSKERGHQNEKEDYLNALKSHSALGRGNAVDTLAKFDVPDGDGSLQFGSFDNLIRLTDDLQKADSQVDSVVHRLERQYIELEPSDAVFRVTSQHESKSFSDYLREWRWDEAKYPKKLSIVDSLTRMMAAVNKCDEEARHKTAQYNELKTQAANIAKKEGASLMNRDLVDVLTPDVVRVNGTAGDDFIYTDHLHTVTVICPRGADQDFLNNYERFADNVVPQSAKRFEELDDKDGNSLWRVIVFKSAAEAFKKACRERRFTPRDFEYSAEGYKTLKAQREEIAGKVDFQQKRMSSLYQAVWSDMMVNWMHIKAMRVFVESVLRYGMPPRFAAFVVVPKAGSMSSVRKGLADVLSSGKQAPTGEKGDGAEDEDDYPYVSLTFTPFAVQR